VPLAESSIVLETDRVEEFAPIKNATGSDSPETARRDLMAVYRFIYYNDNQLHFNFDGRDSYETYREEWEVQLRKWIKAFCKRSDFIRAVLDIMLFSAEAGTIEMPSQRLGLFLQSFFEVRLHPVKGISRLKAA